MFPASTVHFRSAWLFMNLHSFYLGMNEFLKWRRLFPLTLSAIMSLEQASSGKLSYWIKGGRKNKKDKDKNWKSQKTSMIPSSIWLSFISIVDHEMFYERKQICNNVFYLFVSVYCFYVYNDFMAYQQQFNIC